MKWKIWSVISNSHFSRTTNLQTYEAYHFKHSSIFRYFLPGKYITEFFLKTGQISEFPNLNAMLDQTLIAERPECFCLEVPLLILIVCNVQT